MAQVTALRPYNVGGVYVQHRNAASVRRNSGLGWIKQSFIVTPHGLGDDSGTTTTLSLDPTSMGVYNLNETNAPALPASVGNIGTLTIGVLLVYMLTAVVTTR
jgi:hypothetical protein